jgi:hypothetical protein
VLNQTLDRLGVHDRAVVHRWVLERRRQQGEDEMTQGQCLELRGVGGGGEDV